MSELHHLSALEQAKLIRGGEITSVELTEHYLNRIEQLNDSLGAYTFVAPDQAIAQAQAVDDLVRSKVALPSPLAGVVCPVKDLETAAGMPTRFGSRALTLTDAGDANVVSAMRTAGLVFSGKTNTPEFGFPCYTENDIAPPACTPYDLSLSAAGSSGGAGAAVAAGLASIGQGSDGGGSVRLPAAVNGLVGIKPSRGRISNGPTGDSVGDLVVYGPLARTVADAAALLDIMSTPFTGDPYGVVGSDANFLAACESPCGPLRIGVHTDPLVGVTPPTAEVLAAIDSTVSLLEHLGHDVEEMKWPIGQQAVPLFEVLWTTSAAAMPLTDEQWEQTLPLTRYLRDRGQQHTAAELASVVSQIRTLARTAMTQTAGFDVLLSPTAAAGPFPVGSMRNDADPAADFWAQKQWSSYTAVYNVTGQPAISLPLYWNGAGLPIGVQFAGRMGDEATLIALAAQLEEAQSWHDHHPRMW